MDVAPNAMPMIPGPNSPKQARPGMSHPMTGNVMPSFRGDLPFTAHRANPSSKLKPKTFPTCCSPEATKMPSY